MKIRAAASVVLTTLALGGCDDDGKQIDPTPEKLNGAPSHEFEQSDIERAQYATPAVMVGKFVGVPTGTSPDARAST